MFCKSRKVRLARAMAVMGLCMCVQMPTIAATNVPADVLDLTNWKLTLPINDAQEIKRPELDSYEHEDYFKVNEAGDGVIFTAPIEGESTEGSGYPRSELREMTNDGEDKASWSTASGTHIMEITQKVTHIPEVKKHVVVGQIHDAGDDVIVFRLENHKLFIDENGDDGPTLTTDYNLGDEFTVKFVAGNDGVMCYYNGEYIYTYETKTSGCYFKAGMYTQSNLSKGDKAGAYGEVEIFDVQLYHDSQDPQSPSYYEDNFGGTTTEPDTGNDPVPEEESTGAVETVDMEEVSISASGNDGHKPSNTVDGKTSTRWSDKAEDDEYAWIKYDLGSVQAVDNVAIAFYQGKVRYTDVVIEASKDNKNWTTVYSGHSTKKTTGLVDFDFDQTDARYIRIKSEGYEYFDGSESGEWVSLTEVQINH